MAPQRNALPAYDTAPGPNASRYSAAPCPQLGLGVHVERCAVLARQRVEVDAVDRQPSGGVDGCRARQQPQSSGASRRGAGGRVAAHDSGSSVVEPRHLVGRVHAEHRERARETETTRLGQPEPRLRERGVVGDHPAVAVEAVERLGEVAHPRGDAVRRAQRGGLGQHVRVGRERAQELELTLVLERCE